MTLNDYIVELEAIRREHGGQLEVEKSNIGRRFTAYPPVVAYRKIPNKRESAPDFWDEYDGEDRKGEKVVRV
jgi:hypothetical protein